MLIVHVALLQGLWMGIICALVVQVLVLTAAILRTDWGQEVIFLFANVFVHANVNASSSHIF